ncbi:hypothetical protein F7U82_24640 [Vibrio parahaemolyticus]|uniref:hypothetical protein n=1 Tax=Vibrio parahaemolyticus TaxID=670 RepID=UPI00038E4A48|nr:hypothetical protein [Vibrio parahaemolyticus]EJG0923673.1 hypothetical protein [Vibrio parahaemolyticus O1:K68]EJG0933339.1 hypothetical protein [Vibrio parahaemolyticus O1]EJG0947631.1 hypothetical protein [Vibrio parahaemolyticus O10]EQM49578.1 hypothetical protein D051_4026 [Vibrio parahaemolyticus VPCR-2010]EGQ9162802.1 hypothetical protein [Vibrio parahaemolyticus]
MNQNEIDDIRKMVANESYAASQPIDFEKLISDGLIKKVGNSYYTDDFNALPENIKKRVRNPRKGRYGIKLEFTKETKKMAALAEKFKQFRD